MEEVKILILRVVKTNKNNVPRTLVQYATPDVKSNLYKGFMILDQWYDGHTAYDAINEKYIGIPLKAQFVYVRSYRGRADMFIKTIAEENGNCILAVD